VAVGKDGVRETGEAGVALRRPRRGARLPNAVELNPEVGVAECGLGTVEVVQAGVTGASARPLPNVAGGRLPVDGTLKGTNPGSDIECEDRRDSKTCAVSAQMR
jgi:hypothetical protein